MSGGLRRVGEEWHLSCEREIEARIYLLMESQVSFQLFEVTIEGHGAMRVTFLCERGRWRRVPCTILSPLPRCCCVGTCPDSTAMVRGRQPPLRSRSAWP